MSDFRVLLRSSDVLHKVPSNAGLLREGNDLAGTLAGTELGAVHLVPTESGLPTLVDSSAGLFLKVGTTVTTGSINKVIRVGAAYVSSGATRPDVREINNESVDYTGNFWYRADTHDLAINATGEQSAEAWKSLTPRYEREEPTSYTVGGVHQGESFSNITIPEVLDKIFYPLSELSLDLFNIDPSPTGATNNNVIEVGDAVAPPGGVNLRNLSITTLPSSNITSVSYRGGLSLDAMQPAENIFTGGTYSGVGKNRTFTYTQDNPLSYLYPNKFYWEALVTDGTGTTRSGANRYVEWAYRCFAFSEISTTVADPVANYTAKMISEAQAQSKVPAVGIDLGLDKPQAPLHKITKIGKSATGASEYLFIYLPLGRVADGITYEDGYDPYVGVSNEFGFPVAMLEQSIINITRNGITVRYQVYRTAVATAAAYTLDLH